MSNYASMVPLMLHIKKNVKIRGIENRDLERKINREEEKRMCQCGGSSVGWVDEI